MRQLPVLEPLLSQYEAYLGTLRVAYRRVTSLRTHNVHFTRRCGAVRCGAVRCGAVRCGAVRCGAVPVAVLPTARSSLPAGMRDAPSDAQQLQCGRSAMQTDTCSIETAASNCSCCDLISVLRRSDQRCHLSALADNE